MNFRDVSRRLTAGLPGEASRGHLYELKSLEWMFIGARWLWVPALFLLAGMHEPSSYAAIVSISVVTAAVNIAAMILNLSARTVKSQRFLGAAMLTFDSIAAWALIMLFVSDFYTAAYAGFLFVVMEGSIRYGLKGSLVMAATEA